MKLQGLAVMFAVIMIPISIIMSAYTQSNIEVINLQKSYDTKLYSATYDAVRAFQLNTNNNSYSSVSDSKIRDIEAATTTFYNTLATSLGLERI